MYLHIKENILNRLGLISLKIPLDKKKKKKNAFGSSRKASET